MFTNRVYIEVGVDKTDLEQDSLGEGEHSKDLRSILLTQYISYQGLKCPETVSCEVPHHFVESVVEIIKVEHCEIKCCHPLYLYFCIFRMALILIQEITSKGEGGQKPRLQQMQSNAINRGASLQIFDILRTMMTSLTIFTSFQSSGLF